jgi:phosphopantetheine--protein transferase-like protein
MKNKLQKIVDELVEDGKFAVGNDLVFMPDFEKSCTDAFKLKVYTENERAYCDPFSDPLLRYASTWAAKEAVYKAIKQLNPKAIGWKHIEIIREKIAGKPTVIFHPDAERYQISLSISHDGDYVWAVAFIAIR